MRFVRVEGASTDHCHVRSRPVALEHFLHDMVLLVVHIITDAACQVLLRAVAVLAPRDEPVQVLHIEGLRRQPVVRDIVELSANLFWLPEAVPLEVTEGAVRHRFHPIHSALFSFLCPQLSFFFRKNTN